MNAIVDTRSQRNVVLAQVVVKEPCRRGIHKGRESLLRRAQRASDEARILCFLQA